MPGGDPHRSFSLRGSDHPNRAPRFKDSYIGDGGSYTSSSNMGMVRFATMEQRKSLVFQDRGIRDAIMKRQKMMIVMGDDNVTPKNLGSVDLDELELEDLEMPTGGGVSLWGMSMERNRRSYQSQMVQGRERTHSSQSRFSAQHSVTLDMDGIINQINTSIGIDTDIITTGERIIDDSIMVNSARRSVSQPSMAIASTSSQHDEQQAGAGQLPAFIKIVVRETDDIDLYSSNSITVPKDSSEAPCVEESNKRYDYLTVGKGKSRRTSEAEAQTAMTLYKSRAVNTDRVRRANVGSYVSNFDMFDTYAELERSTHTLESTGDEEVKIAVTTYAGGGLLDEVDAMLSTNENFKLSSMVLQRLLAGNTFRSRQKRFRNMIMPNPLDLTIRYTYRLDELWRYALTGVTGSAVSCLSWCHANGDLLAIGYGVYSHQASASRHEGYVGVWSIKNPRNPERLYRFAVPVTAVAFSRDNPQLLAIGTFGGSVEVVDISDDSTARVACSQRETSPGMEPVWAIEWIRVDAAEELLTVAEDGLVMKYSMCNGPGLIGFRQIRLDRVEGAVEGLQVARKNSGHLGADRHPQALVLQIDPQKADIFYVGTDEGCLHRCSTFFPHQYAGIMQAHQGVIGAMEFSPWSPKIFLTCGHDWKVRIWIDEIYEPVLELCSGFEAVRTAHWSPIHAALLVCVTRKQVELWNIRKNVIRPASVTMFYAGNVELTTCAYSGCGRTLVVGDANGATHVCALEDMPFAPHFQYLELQTAIYQALVAKPELLRQVKSLGYLGYPRGEQRKR